MFFNILAVIQSKNLNAVLMKITEEKIGRKEKKKSGRQLFIGILTT